MIPREILKKIRQIEIRTNRLVNETLAGQYHSVFKGQGMNFDEVREYQPGDEVRTIDWNVTARMNHPFVKKFVEERELTVMLVVDVSGSGLFGSAGAVQARAGGGDCVRAGLLRHPQQRQGGPDPVHRRGREVHSAPQRPAARPARHPRGAVLRAAHRGTDLNEALEFLLRVTPHRAIAVVISDFIGSPAVPKGRRRGKLRPQMMLLESLAQASFTRLRQANRRHDLVAVQIADRYELELPALGRLVLTTPRRARWSRSTRATNASAPPSPNARPAPKPTWRGCSARRALTRSSCAPTSLTRRSWASSSRRARNGGCAAEYESKV